MVLIIHFYKKNWEAFTFCIWSIWTTSMKRGVTVWFNTIAHYTGDLHVITFFSVLVIVIQSLCEEWLRYILFLGDTRDQNQLDAVKIHKGRDWKLDATSPAVCGRGESVQAARQSSPTVVCQTSHCKHLTLLRSLALKRCLHDSLRDIQPLLSRPADLSHHHHRKPDAFLSHNGRRPGKLLLQIKRYMENWKQYFLQYFLAVTETWTRDCVETKCQSNNCERFQRCLYQTMATITRRRRLIRTSYSRWLRR